MHSNDLAKTALSLCYDSSDITDLNTTPVSLELYHAGSAFISRCQWRFQISFEFLEHNVVDG